MGSVGRGVGKPDRERVVIIARDGRAKRVRGATLQVSIASAAG